MIVLTETSRYEIDPKGLTFTRMPGLGAGTEYPHRTVQLSKFDFDHTPTALHAVPEPVVGEPMFLRLAEGGYVRTTRVREIHRGITVSWPEPPA